MFCQSGWLISPERKAASIEGGSVRRRAVISEARFARASGFDCVARTGFASQSPTSFAVSCEAGMPVLGSRQLRKSPGEILPVIAPASRLSFAEFCASCWGRRGRPLYLRSAE